MGTAYKWCNTTLFVAMIVINALANLLPINGNSTGDVSSQTPTLFTPAPYTFAIWGVIYLLMGIFILYQLRLPTESAEFVKIKNGVSIWFMVSCLMNIGWIFTWHYHRFGLSVLFIVGLLVSLIIINSGLTIDPTTGMGERTSIYGFNIYLGWICAATIANVGVFLASINWTRFGLSEQFWTIVVLIVGTILGIAFALNGFRYMATFAIVWAYIGIFVKHITAKGYGNAFPLIVTVVAFAVVLMLAVVVLASMKPEYALTKEF